MRAALRALATAEILERCRTAADVFTTDALPLGDEEQTPEDYVAQVSATTGLPLVMVRRNMDGSRACCAGCRRCSPASPAAWTSTCSTAGAGSTAATR